MHEIWLPHAVFVVKKNKNAHIFNLKSPKSLVVQQAKLFF